MLTVAVLAAVFRAIIGALAGLVGGRRHLRRPRRTRPRPVDGRGCVRSLSVVRTAAAPANYPAPVWLALFPGRLMGAVDARGRCRQRPGFGAYRRSSIDCTCWICSCYGRAAARPTWIMVSLLLSIAQAKMTPTPIPPKGILVEWGSSRRAGRGASAMSASPMPSPPGRWLVWSPRPRPWAAPDSSRSLTSTTPSGRPSVTPSRVPGVTTAM